MRARYMTFVCVCAVLALTINVGGASAQNLLVNPGFETGDFTGWVLSGLGTSSFATVQSPDNGPSAAGTHNCFLDNQAQALGLTLKQSTPPGSVTGGTVDWSMDLKLDAADVGGVVFIQVFAEQTGVGIVGGSGLIGPVWPWGAWANFSGSFEAPAGTDFLTIQVTATTGAAEGSTCLVHVDNVSLEGQGSVPVEPTSWGRIKAQFE